MCGIFCFISKTSSLTIGNEQASSCRCLLENRGPNGVGQAVHDSRVLLLASVLWQQGLEMCRQPIDEGRLILLFNGDLFMDRGGSTAESDSRWLYDLLLANLTAGEHDLFGLFSLLKGPFSLLLLDKQTGRVYFARDSLGRNSLLFNSSEDGIIISSVLGNTLPTDSVELPPVGLYYLDLADVTLSLHLVPWESCGSSEIPSIVKCVEDQRINIPWLIVQRNKFKFHYHTILKDSSLSNKAPFEYLLGIPEVSDLCQELIRLLAQSVKERVINTTRYCKQCIEERRTTCCHARIGILFSGGIDCTILALLADEFVDKDLPIDMLNVSFEKVVRPAAGSKRIDASNACINWDVPDRVTGRTSLAELQRLRPHRTWNFVEINVTRAELGSFKQKISDLVFPLKSVLDESLGAALWFASRGRGVCDGADYQSAARVVLLGSGADELFGGYSRHRVAFLRDLPKTSTDYRDEDVEQAFENLTKELDLDWSRLPSRNLARDDRVICDHGTTPRTPYLQEDFVSLVQSLRASQRCYFPLGAGVGDKLTLRLCGYKLGLTSAALLQKRALQFGSRIADRKQNARDNSSFLAAD